MKARLGAAIMLAVALNLAATVTLHAAANVPQLLNYQAVLKSSGVPVTNQVNVTFTIYDQEAKGTGTVLWTETRLITPDSDGRINVRLGESTPLDESVFSGADRWLGIQVESDPEMAPRAPLASSSYSFKVGTVDGAKGGALQGGLTLNEAAKDAEAADVALVTLISLEGDSATIAPGALRMINNIGEEQVAMRNDPSDGGTLSLRLDGSQSAEHTAAASSYYAPTAKGAATSVKTAEIGAQGLTLFDDVLGSPIARIDQNGRVQATGLGVQTPAPAKKSAACTNPEANQGVGVNGNNGFGSNLDLSTASNSFTVGYCNTIINDGSVAFGSENSVSGDGSFAIGENNTISSNRSVAVGGSNDVSGEDNMIIGQFNWMNCQNSSILGGINDTIYGGGNHVVAGGQHNVIENGSANSIWNTITGGKDNRITEPDTGLQVITQFATISGGAANQAYGTHPTVGGGYGNRAEGYRVTVAGGNANVATGYYSFVGGGDQNVASGASSVVGGGGQAFAGRNQAIGDYSAVLGGHYNVATGDVSSIGGGYFNTITGASGQWNTIAGGNHNTVSGNFNSSAIGGGVNNTTNNGGATIAGGNDNDAAGSMSSVLGGVQNAANGYAGSVGGGVRDTANGDYSTVPGGNLNLASGNYSFAAGRRAKANHDGAFVWGDSFDGDVASSAADQFIVRASGGTTFYSSTDLSTGVTLAAGGGAWAALSDRNVKTNIRPVNEEDILNKIAQLDISRWSYQTQDPSIEHIGPMAQDFYRLFGVGDNNRTITTVDPDGIALAAIKALQKKTEEIDELRDQLARLQAEIEQLQARQ